ncbi:MAG: hypothetical protein JJV89_05780 [Desulfosarcina sp.]|nr:hypothetical protein [Desulfobacterales bacterium]
MILSIFEQGSKVALTPFPLYGDKAFDWLMTKPILAQFKSKDKYKAYREKVQQYSDEEKSLWEDFRHGMIIGTKEFVDRIRSKYMPDNFHKEIP